MDATKGAYVALLKNLLETYLAIQTNEQVTEGELSRLRTRITKACDALDEIERFEKAH